jgi:hypothetical protein
MSSECARGASNFSDERADIGIYYYFRGSLTLPTSGRDYLIVLAGVDIRESYSRVIFSTLTGNVTPGSETVVDLVLVTGGFSTQQFFVLENI